MICLAEDVMCLHEPCILCLDSFQTLLQEKGNEGPPTFHDMALWVRDIKDRWTIYVPDTTQGLLTLYEFYDFSKEIIICHTKCVRQTDLFQLKQCFCLWCCQDNVFYCQSISCSDFLWSKQPMHCQLADSPQHRAKMIRRCTLILALLPQNVS